MHRTIQLASFILCGGLLLLCLLGPLLVWVEEGQALVMPGATEIQVERLSIGRERIMYHLPPNQSLADIAPHLLRHGWTHDLPAEHAFKRDQSDIAAIMIFGRHHWLGFVSEVAVVRPGSHDQRQADIQHSRCIILALAQVA